MSATESVQQGLTMVQQVSNTVIDYLVKYGLQVLGGIIIILVGIWIANRVAKIILEMLLKRHMDITLAKFLAGTVKATVLIFAVLMGIEKFGVTISPLIATISAAIFGASFAIQAPLSNYAAGLSVILTRPFAVGNTITVKDVHGVVEDIKLPCTILINADGEKITIPNKDVVGEVVFNSGHNKLVERTVGISYADDPQKAVRVISDALMGYPGVVQTPAPQIGIDNFGNSSIDIAMRYWAPTRQYYQTLHGVNLAVFTALGKAGITIPFPQRDLHIVSNGAALTSTGIRDNKN